MTEYRVYVRVNGSHLWPLDVWARNEYDAKVCAKLSLVLMAPNR